MTAEIAVLHRVGVALAADSAVTVGRTADKIWTSADKLFQLSETDHVGIMVYGNAQFVGLPWETIIKCYREQSGRTSLATVAAHAETFWDYLRGNQRLFSETSQTRAVQEFMAFLRLKFRQILRAALDTEAEKKDGLEERDVVRIADSEVLQLIKQLRRLPPLVGIGIGDRVRARALYAAAASTLFDEIFGELPFGRRASLG